VDSSFGKYFLQNKEVEVGAWSGAEVAKAAFKKSCEMYQATK
jgi:inorganic pyrophosphatase